MALLPVPYLSIVDSVKHMSIGDSDLKEYEKEHSVFVLVDT